MLTDKQNDAYDLTLKPLLPLGLQSFAEIREERNSYVDKTSLIYRLYKLRQQFFLSRPRRFGKSTVVSTFEELFRHGLEPYDGHDSYFKGLEIERLWTAEDQQAGPFLLMHLDFSNLCQAKSSPEAFEQGLCAKLEKYALEFGVTLSDKSDSSFLKFQELVEGLGWCSIVLLVDEYDAPLTVHINDPDDSEFNAVLEILRGFFLTVKTKSSKFRFVFVTGITRFKDASIFTAGNTIQDISQDPKFGTLCGVTREELQRFFPEHLRYAAAAMSDRRLEEVSEEDRQCFLDHMAEWYDGYSFDEAHRTQVFCLWSVLRFFNELIGYFKAYWYDDGGLPTVLRRSLLGNDLPAALAQIAANDVEVAKDAFLHPASFSTMDPKVLLFQTGYLTIKAPFGQSMSVTLGLPNKEIAEGVSRLLLSSFAASRGAGLEKLFAQSRQLLVPAINEQQAEDFQEGLNLFLRSIDYEHHPIKEESGATFFVSFFLSCALGIFVDSNRHEARGRPDVIFDYQDCTVVLELKFLDKGEDDEAQQKLAEALEQIRDRNFGNTLRRKAKLWRLGLVFSRDQKVLIAAGDADLPPQPSGAGQERQREARC